METIGQWLAPFSAYLTGAFWLNLTQAAIILLLGLTLAKVLATVAGRVFDARLDAHGKMILRRAVFYLVLGLAVASALHQLGFRLGVLLGAAGVLSVAIGFASQTSASNLISGLFLMGERPFGVGDVVSVGGTTGEVLSIDLLSVKLRTFDNLYVRLPNEMVIKSQVTNMSRFPIRRAEIAVGVAYKEDIKKVRRVLLDVAQRNPLCLEEPRPVALVNGFGDSAINLQLNVWTKRENFVELRISLQEQIKLAFDEAGIEIPFPHMSLYAGSATAPIPVQLMAEDKRSGEAAGQDQPG